MQRGSGISMRRSGHFAPAFLQLTLPAQTHYSQSQMQAHWNWPQAVLQVLSCELVQRANLLLAVHADVKDTQRGHVGLQLRVHRRNWKDTGKGTE